MNTVNQEKPLLIAIAVSHYCEKVRWALDYLNVDYVEENHAPPFHRQYTSRYGGTTVPVLIIDNKALVDSHDILHYLNRVSTDKQLYPQNIELRDRVEIIEKLCDDQLGGATRCWGYYYAMQTPKLVERAWSKGTSATEKKQNASVFHKTLELFKQNYNISTEGKQIALQTIRKTFSALNQKLSLGQKYLVGDRLSAADITFAALAAPVIRPEHHPVYDSQLSKMPTEMVEVIQELRNTPAGKLVARMYCEHRHEQDR
ncbi:glutathione S-transferase family protein [Pleurocapsa sp. PCC 7319]|uniref:glutathione S-transferase family protein n=1 Tax=Pleurocapsa sp. PCC 7319 TaxID=118161 RepID=UPI000346FBC6|nr:glutathione S-transferase family protein [Pleurocapsa sp. PCC 7319]